MFLERDDLPVSTSLQRSSAVVFIEQKILQRSQKKCAKPALFLVRTAQSVLLKQISEKTLDEILCISRGIPAVAKKTVKRRPIGFAKSGECLPSGFR